MSNKYLYSFRTLAVGLMALASTSMWASTGDVLLQESFDTQEAFESWTIVDQNGGRTWEFLNGMAAYMLDYQTGLPGDDYYISPEFELDADKVYAATSGKYRLAFYAYSEPN